MLALNYNTIISAASDDVSRSKKKINFFFGENSFLSFIASFFTAQQKTIEKVFSAQLIMSKGLLVDLQQKAEVLKNKDVSFLIDTLNILIDNNIDAVSIMQQHLDKNFDGKHAELEALNASVLETIDNLYSCLRILKKGNKQENIETSDIAKDAAARTAKTLKHLYAN